MNIHMITEETKMFIIQETAKLVLEGIAKSKEETKSEPETEYVTRKWCAELLGVSLVTISDWSNRGILKRLKIGSRVRYKKTQVLSALREIEEKRA